MWALLTTHEHSSFSCYCQSLLLINLRSWLWIWTYDSRNPIIISFFRCQSVSLLFSLSCLHVSTFGRVTSMVCTCTMNGCRTNRRSFLLPAWATSDNSHGPWIVNPTLSTGQQLAMDQHWTCTFITQVIKDPSWECVPGSEKGPSRLSIVSATTPLFRQLCSSAVGKGGSFGNPFHNQVFLSKPTQTVSCVCF